MYSVTLDGSAFANDENGTLELSEECLSTTITPMEGKTISRREGNNSKTGNSNSGNISDSDGNSNSNSNSDSESKKKNSSSSASGGGKRRRKAAAYESDGSTNTMDSCESQNTIDLNEGDDNNESEGEYDEDPIMECNQVDEATDVDVVFQEGDDGEIIRVGPKKSTAKREWKQCSAVDYDPSTQGDRRFKGVSQIK